MHSVEWEVQGTPKAIIHIVHGATEYIERYEDIAQKLVKNGFMVVGSDIRGHGNSIMENTPMYFGPKGSWDELVQDVRSYKQKIQECYPKVPYFFLGFSLGSFIIRTYLVKYQDDISGAILIGTSTVTAIEYTFMKAIVEIERRRVGEKNASDLLYQVMFCVPSKRIKPRRKDQDWLCADEKALDDYIEDRRCYKLMTPGMLRELMDAMYNTGLYKNFSKMKKELPILFIAGAEDSTSKGGKNVEKLAKKWIKAGMNHIEVQIYPKMRHDVLREKEADQVIKNIINWIQNCKI